MRIVLVLLISLLSFARPGFGAVPLSDDELSNIRAGYIEADGMQFAIGATMTSYVDGNMVLRSTLSMDQTGITTARDLGAGTQPLDAAAAAGITTGDQPGYGAFVPGAGGGTAFLQSLTGDRIAGLVVNTASDRTILQQTNVTIMVPDLPALQQQIGLAGFATRIHDSLGIGLLNAAR